VIVIGASSDSPEVNKAWKEKHGFPFPLICDKERVLPKLFGTDEVRWSVFIDESRKVKTFCSAVCGDESTFNEKYFFAEEILEWA
jgi:peroxiredoxin